MKRLLPLLLICAGCAGSSTIHAAPLGHSPSPSAAADLPTPNPQVRYGESCDYLLGDFTESSRGFRFIARATLFNRGNVGAVVRVRASWVQVGSRDVVASKTVRVPYKGRRAVNFSVVVGQDQIDKIQAYSGSENCQVRSRIVDEFGEVHG